MKERRRAPRITAQLAMEIKLGGGERASVETINVSANGIYFSSKSYIEPLTKLEITLLLPGGDLRSDSTRRVACEGVVVRTEPELPSDDHSEYDIACYFTEIAENDKEDLESYILQQMAF